MRDASCMRGCATSTATTQRRLPKQSRYAAGHDVDLRPVELDVSSQRSVDEAVGTVISEQGGIDVLLHNAGHMVTGPTEAFTPEQIADIYDTNVLGTQRLNRAALPHMRARQLGLVIWIGSTSTRGGIPPSLGPYFAAKAGMDALAVSYAAELSRFDIRTTIIVPGSFTKGTNHFAHSGHPADDAVVAEYDAAYPNLIADVSQRLAERPRPTRTWLTSPPRSCTWSRCGTGPDRFACTSIPPTMAPRSSTPSQIESAPNS
jgi:NAD(P)-dependent dehydrogenase (short-subunit alcohol dehydrogenase family)